MYFGLAMRRRRKQLDLRQEDCYEFAGISQANWSKWETGRLNRDEPPAHATVLRIANVLEMPEDVALGACGLCSEQAKQDALNALMSLTATDRAISTGPAVLTGDDICDVLLARAVQLERLMARVHVIDGVLGHYTKAIYQLAAQSRELAAQIRKFNLVPDVTGK